jgi:hypothetical protein
MHASEEPPSIPQEKEKRGDKPSKRQKERGSHVPNLAKK